MNPLILQQNSITLLSLEWTVSSVVGEDLCWVAKLSTPQIHQLLVWSHLRISQPPVIETLKRKYLRMNVYSSQWFFLAFSLVKIISINSVILDEVWRIFSHRLYNKLIAHVFILINDLFKRKVQELPVVLIVPLLEW